MGSLEASHSPVVGVACQGGGVWEVHSQQEVEASQEGMHTPAGGTGDLQESSHFNHRLQLQALSQFQCFNLLRSKTHLVRLGTFHAELASSWTHPYVKKAGVTVTVSAIRS